MSCEVKVRYCVPLKGRWSYLEETIEVGEGSKLNQLLSLLAERHNLDEHFLANCLITINGKGAFQLDGLDTELRTGDEIAFLPPLSGG